ncbi:fimbrial protein [Pseudomonas knackmussii]|uniref:fimbrial protein n=1 Tax=Pseudomonas knackmussii TaxID=65741 RepID=UPI001363C786|nr:fimbrial protein [Pseudomonas knackmussii]
MKRNKTRLASLALLGAASLHAEGLLACTSKVTTSVDFPSPMLIAVDFPLGTVLGTATVVTTLDCMDDLGLYELRRSKSNAGYGMSDVEGVVQSGFVAVGVRWTNHNSATGETTLMTSAQMNSSAGPKLPLEKGVITLTDTWEFIKVGSGALPAPGNFTMQAVAMDKTVRQSAAIAVSDQLTYQFAPAQFVVPSCRAPGDLTVDMGQKRNTDFSGVGSTTPAKPIDIALQCEQNANVFITLSGDIDSSQPGTLKLSPSGQTASGVGVQILDEAGVPVAFDTKLSHGQTSEAGPYTLKYQARYIQTAKTIVAGQANAALTYTLKYN